MSNKLGAAFHGVPCQGECDKNPHGVCAHGRACQFHLREEVQRAKAEKEATARMEAFKPWR
jgi:hypothetical protein